MNRAKIIVIHKKCQVILRVFPLFFCSLFTSCISLRWHSSSNNMLNLNLHKCMFIYTNHCLSSHHNGFEVTECQCRHSSVSLLVVFLEEPVSCESESVCHLRSTLLSLFFLFVFYINTLEGLHICLCLNRNLPQWSDSLCDLIN